MRRLARLSVPVALAAILLAGCSAEPPGSGADPAPAATDGAAESGADRQVVHVGDLDLIAADVPGTAGRAIAAVTAVDGFVAGDRRSDRDGSATATLTLRIPAEAYTATVETLAALGEERSRQLSTTDVTEESVDLDTRIATKKASVDRVRELMVDADSLSEVVALEAELTTRETELAELQAEQRGLGDAIAYGTLTLKLSAPATVDESADGPAGFVGVL
ncbi:MAG: DUF4349 domain-containing protein, partial [Agromyces sp.]|nr:DUF4349 domain-containing protein [Agromyces sp.]